MKVCSTITLMFDFCDFFYIYIFFSNFEKHFYLHHYHQSVVIIVIKGRVRNSFTLLTAYSIPIENICVSAGSHKHFTIAAA